MDRKDLQMELWDELARYKAEALREICLGGGGGVGDGSSSDDDENNEDSTRRMKEELYRSLWHRVNSELEEGEELENRPDLIALLEESILKNKQQLQQKLEDTSSSSSSSVSSSSPPPQSSQNIDRIVNTELNRLDLMMRFFDKSTEYSGKSRRSIYEEYQNKKKEKSVKKEQTT
jgi:hypothetical protein